MNKRLTADDTLLELWAIKDETAARFGSAADYLTHLGLNSKARAGQRTATPSLRDSLPRSKQTPSGKLRRARVA